MRGHGVSQLPVCKNEPPFAAAEVLGAVDELALMDLAIRDAAVLDTPVEKVMGPRCRRSASASRSSSPSRCSTRAPALLVLAGGRPLVVLTRTDVLAFLDRGRRWRQDAMTGTRGFETRAIHAGQEPDAATGAVVPRSRSRRRSRRPTSASTRASSTRAPATRPAPRSRRASPRWRARATASRSPAVWPPRTRCCASCRSARTSCSATTPTAARSG